MQKFIILEKIIYFNIVSILLLEVYMFHQAQHMKGIFSSIKGLIFHCIFLLFCWNALMVWKTLCETL